MMKLWAFLGLLVELRNKHGLNKQGKHISSLGIWGTEMDDYIRDEYWILMMRLQLAVMILIHGCFDSRPNLFEKQHSNWGPRKSAWNGDLESSWMLQFWAKNRGKTIPLPPLPPFLPFWSYIYIYVILYQMLASASINGIPLAAPQEWVPDPSHKPVASIVTVSIVVVVRTSNPLVIGINNDLFMNIIPSKT